MNLAPRTLLQRLAALLMLGTTPALAGGIEGSVATGLVANSDAQVKGSEEHYRFSGAAFTGSLLFPGHENNWLGVFYGNEWLVNNHIKDDARESMTIEDYGIMAALVSPKYAFQFFGALGLSNAEIRQSKPADHVNTYQGYMIKLGFQGGILGDRDMNIFLRAEVNLREYSSGKDPDNSSAKLLPVEHVSVPLYIGALFRI